MLSQIPTRPTSLLADLPHVHSPTLTDVALYPDDRYALVQTRAFVTGQWIVDNGMAVIRHPDWQPGFTEVWDLTLCAGVDLVPSDTAKIVAAEKAMAAHLAGSTTVVITNKTFVLYAIQLFSVLMRPLGRRVVVFNSQADAAQYLNISALPILSP